MCGIAGVFGAAAHPDTLQSMLAVAARRGPEGTNSCAHPDGLVGHAALRFVEIEHNAQPLRLEDGSLLVWNGQIYNWRTLNAEHQLAAATDTQALLHGLRRFGSAFLREIEGQFAFIAYFASGPFAGRSMLGRDKWGICPLVYGSCGTAGLAIGSTAEVVQRAGVRDVRSVPAGTYGWLRPSSVELATWYRLPAAQSGEPIALDRVRALVEARVLSRIPDQPRELFTTLGGIDSQFVTTCVARALRGGFGGAVTVVPHAAGSSSDLPFVQHTLAMLKAENIDVPHHIAVLTPEFVAANIDRLLNLLGPDLFHVLCGLAEDLVAQTVKAHGGRAIMTAGGPDEAGRSYDRWTFLHLGLDEERAWHRLCEQFGSSEGVRAGLVFGEHGIENRVPLADLIELSAQIPASQKQRVLDPGDGRSLASLRMESKLFWRAALRGMLPAQCLEARKEPIHGSTGAMSALREVARADARFAQDRHNFALHAWQLGWNGIVFGKLWELDPDNALTECQLYALYRWSLLQPQLFALGGEHRYGPYVEYLPRFVDEPTLRTFKPLCYDWQLGFDVPLRAIE